MNMIYYDFYTEILVFLSWDFMGFFYMKKTY
jgi:hypothetical protein